MHPGRMQNGDGPVRRSARGADRCGCAGGLRPDGGTPPTDLAAGTAGDVSTLFPSVPLRARSRLGQRPVGSPSDPS